MDEYEIKERWYIFRTVVGGILALDDLFSSYGYETKEAAIKHLINALGAYTDRFIIPKIEIGEKLR